MKQYISFLTPHKASAFAGMPGGVKCATLNALRSPNL